MRNTGFISFNETYYRRKLEAFERKTLTAADIYEIRQLLKVLDDLTDEGYSNLNNHMEENFSCLTRLRALLKQAGASPFPMPRNERKSTAYTDEEHELSELLETLMAEAEAGGEISDNLFLKDIRDYSEWIPFEPDTAYVFLLRDTLLPCVYFKKRHGAHVYPWLISRRFLEDVTGVKFVDDDIRLPIYEALEQGHTAFEACCRFCRKEMLEVLEDYPKLKQILLNLLGSLKEKRIVVVESGYMGTIPMLLKALDDRVTFRLYTTAPFLYDTYGAQCFCRRYEDVRKFETVYAQDLLLRYASFRDGRFYVNLSEDGNVRKRALGEIHEFMR